MPCDDPGMVPDAKQVATSYLANNEVTYECTRDGFDVDNAAPLVCTSDAGSGTVSWNPATRPNCVGKLWLCCRKYHLGLKFYKIELFLFYL